jgi:hypothetical protein
VNGPASNHPGKPPPPTLERPKERRSPLDAHVWERVEDGAGLAWLADFKHGLTELDLGPRLKGVQWEAGQGNVLAQLAGLDRPAFGSQVGQDLLAEEEDRLVRVAVRLLGPPAVEIALHALVGDSELRDGPLGKAASAPLLRFEMKLNDATVHGHPPAEL